MTHEWHNLIGTTCQGATQTQQKSIRGGHFYNSMCSNVISQSSVDTTVKLVQTGKPMLHVFSQG